VVRQCGDQYPGDDGCRLAKPGGERERERIFNLGYFTWVEQQGVALEHFEQRRSQQFWRGLREVPARWDEMIAAFNRDTGMSAAS